MTAEAYTFLQSKDYAYYLDYTRAGVVVADETTLERVEGCGIEPWLRHVLVVGAPRSSARARPPSGRSPPRRPRARAGSDHAGRHRALEVHDGQHGAAEGGGTPAAQPAPQLRLVRARCARGDGDDVVLPVPKLFFGYARDLTALYPLGVGGAGIVFPERTTPERIFELVARTGRASSFRFRR